VIPVFKTNKWNILLFTTALLIQADARSLDVIHRRRGFDRGLGYHFVMDNGTNTKVEGQIEASPRWINRWTALIVMPMDE